MKHKIPLFILVTVLVVAANILFPTLAYSTRSSGGAKTGGYFYSVSTQNNATVWSIGISGRETEKQITENNNNISTLTDFKQSVDNIITNKANLFLLITLFGYSIFVLFLLWGRPRSYRLGLLRGIAGAAAVFMLFCSVYSYSNLSVAGDRAQFYYNLLVSQR